MQSTRSGEGGEGVASFTENHSSGRAGWLAAGFDDFTLHQESLEGISLSDQTEAPPYLYRTMETES